MLHELFVYLHEVAIEYVFIAPGKYLPFTAPYIILGGTWCNYCCLVLMIFGGERDVQLLGSHLPPASVVCTV